VNWRFGGVFGNREGGIYIDLFLREGSRQKQAQKNNEGGMRASVRVTSKWEMHGFRLPLPECKSGSALANQLKITFESNDLERL